MAKASPIKTEGEILRQPAEIKYAEELAYLAEAETFSRIDLQDLADTAAEEYPEYNGGVA